MTTSSIDRTACDDGFARLKESVVDHYETALRAHGPTARGMDWKDEESQRLRFAVLSGCFDLNGKSVHEVGAGAGHLYDVLQAEGFRADYSGSDLSADMVQAARRGHPGVTFHCWDILAEPDLPTFDVVVCSGLFHVKLGHTESAWWEFVYDMVRQMYRMCRVGIAFNMISDDVDFRATNLFYSNPGTVVDFCRRELSRFVALRHDYPLYEYTVSVYREARH